MYSPLLARFISPDSMVTDPSVPAALNRYAYVGNNPLNYTDPDGHCWPVCTTLAGAVLGGLFAAGTQMLSNLAEGKPLDTNLGEAVAVGAVSGAVGGLTFGVGLALGGAAAAAVGITAGSGMLATLAGAATVASSGVLAGQASRATANVLQGQPLGEGLFEPSDMALDAVASIASFKVFGGNLRTVTYTDLAGRGAYAVEGIPATGPQSTSAQRAAIQKIGNKYGCHHCGSRSPQAQQWFFDHIPPTKIASGTTQIGYPQCRICLEKQATALRHPQAYSRIVRTPVRGYLHVPAYQVNE
jgi:hypothetical protein